MQITKAQTSLHIHAIRSALICLLQSMIHRHDLSILSRFLLVSAAEQAGLRMTIRNPLDRLTRNEAHIIKVNHITKNTLFKVILICLQMIILNHV